MSEVSFYNSFVIELLNKVKTKEGLIQKRMRDQYVAVRRIMLMSQQQLMQWQ